VLTALVSLAVGARPIGVGAVWQAMRAGRIVASGTPDEVLTEDLLCDVFDLDARVVPDPVTGTPLVVPIGRRSRVDPGRRP
jgi:hypothetical protein